MPHMSPSKTAVPPLPTGFVSRPRVLSLLDRADRADVMLLSAPAGFGKTTALAEWTLASDSRYTRWLCLDEDDNDPTRLRSGLLAALAGCPGVPADSPLYEDASGRPGDRPEFMGDIVEAVGAAAMELRLVLDDVDEIVEARALRGLRTLLRHRPANLHIVMAGRRDPPLALPKLHLEGRLSELRADDLRFSWAETAALLTAAGVAARPEQIDTLNALCDGWAAGLRLAALSMQQAADTASFVSTFAADDRPLADYLVGEVLSHLTPDEQHLLSVTSVCDGLSPELAAELTGRDDAGELLDALARSTSLVVRGPPPRSDVYRTRTLLRSYLRAYMDRQRPTLVADLDGRAADWWADREQPVRALEHAARGGGAARLREMLHRFGVPLLLSGDHRPLRRALDRLADTSSDQDPWAALTSALVHLEAGELTAAHHDLLVADARWPDDGPAELVVLRIVADFDVAVSSGELSRAKDAAQELDGVSATDPAVAALAHLTRASACLLSVGGRTDVRAELAAALELARSRGFGYLELQCQAQIGAVAGLDGDYRAMAAAGEKAAVIAGAHGWQDSVWSRAAHLMLGDAALYRAEPALALRHSAQAAGPDGPAGPALGHAVGVLRGAALFDLGEQAAGLREMQQARLDLGVVYVAPEQAAAAALLEHRAALLLGHAAAASTVLSWVSERLGIPGEMLLMRAWVEAAAGNHGAARERMGPLLTGAMEPLLPHTVVEALVLESRLAALAGDRPAARRALHAALDQAEPIDALRPFALAGPEVRELLVHALGSFGTLEPFAARAIAAPWPAPDRPGTVLSDRELTVLSLLPSLLSLDEIAADLAISINTVKSHIRAIYAKLGVSSRRSAVVAAYEQRLLPLVSR
ncbi:LuxR C-terminal-related transcriptional regulator [Pseudonocardia bannensis]|uniref:Helix-turn-helix transcriptional regulator n=1 Tax=Pseudonocardia bannensis TaxID=630973 RepID=A0A848DIA6_9PSEU|nr:LuxR C-terminal-related transcriptional regulator [Pseudonocardia bannensis]NMH92276.1 helix-turn-helix transcriptional regulator [Pseudonocardia bannensis]